MSHDNKKIKINSIKITADSTSCTDSRFNKYVIEIGLKNESLVPVSFWSMKCGWFLNFVFNRKDVYFKCNCISDMPQFITVYNNKNVLFKGIVLSKNKIDQEFAKRIFAGFVFYDTLQFTRANYHSAIFKKVGRAKKIHTKKLNYPDTIWCKRPIEFVDIKKRNNTL
jgi:hypothetical protein